MSDIIKKIFYYKKISALWQRGIKQGDILPFDEEFYSKMKNTYIVSLPVYIWIKYFKPIIPTGKCYERSLYMFLCFDDAKLVRGNIKNLELKYGKDNAEHGWIEIGDYVYDPSLLVKIKKDLYYKINEPKNVIKCNHDEYKKDCEEFYNDVKTTTIEDFMPNGRKRTDLITIIPTLMAYVNSSSNEELMHDFDDYIQAIKYDEQQIYEELNDKVLNLIKKK